MKTTLQLDRREFLGNMILAIGGASVVAMAPFASASTEANAAGPYGDWTIDDICGAYPPYSHPIPFGRAPAAGDSLIAHADPADRIFLA